MAKPRESLEVLAQAAQDHAAQMSPSARKFYLPGAQQAVNDMVAALDALDATRDELVALKMKYEPPKAAPSEKE